MSRIPSQPALKPARSLAGAWAEIALLVLLVATALVVIFQHQLLDRTITLTPDTIAARPVQVIDDKPEGGNSVVTREGPLHWRCDLRAGVDYPYCAFELFFDSDMGTKGIDLTHMHEMRITMLYKGQAGSYRVYLKNFNPLYAKRTDDGTPKSLRVEPLTKPGRLDRVELILADFAVPDWWLRARGMAPEFGRPEFDNITSLTFETGSDAPTGVHEFDVRDITIRTSIISDAQFYSLLLGGWAVAIVSYLGFRLFNMRRYGRERRLLQELALKEAQEAARRDPLTLLLNRRGLTERYGEMAAQRGGQRSVAVVVLDVDHFKRLNDTHGHDTGDAALRVLADLLGRHVRSVDLTARWGGEEFIVVCAGIDRRGASRVAQKLRAAIAGHNFGPCGQMTASFGISWAAEMPDDLTPLVAQADAALYDAKAAGRNCCRFYKVSTLRAA